MPTINYIYHGNQYLCETDENDTPTKLYVNEPGTYTNLVSQKDLTTGEKSYPLYDAVGSTRAVTDSNGDVADTFVYDAWGNVLDRTGATEIPFQYVGKYGYYRDEETVAYYVMLRLYSSTIIRWISLDPIRQPPVLSYYAYSHNTPLRFIDPGGRQEELAAQGNCAVKCRDPEGNVRQLGRLYMTPVDGNIFHRNREDDSWKTKDYPGATGISVGIHFRPDEGSKVKEWCCCDVNPPFKFLQFFESDWNIDDPIGFDGNPYYIGTPQKSRGRLPPILGLPNEMYDAPHVIPEDFGAKKTIQIKFTTCLVCDRARPKKDAIVGCVHWGFKIEATKIQPTIVGKITVLPRSCSERPKDDGLFMRMLKQNCSSVFEELAGANENAPVCAEPC
jgi:RHS repeat-associated protein